MAAACGRESTFASSSSMPARKPLTAADLLQAMIGLRGGAGAGASSSGGRASASLGSAVADPATPEPSPRAGLAGGAVAAAAVSPSGHEDS
eukprot:11752772-Alexandrium_andersonii.AAC.1